MNTLKQGQGAGERATVLAAIRERGALLGAAILFVGRAQSVSIALAVLAASIRRAITWPAIQDAKAVLRLADAAARRFKRKIEAEGGREITASQLEEIAAIYRAEIIRTWDRIPYLPAVDQAGYAPALWAHEPVGVTPFYSPNGCAPLRYAMRRATTQARSHNWGRGAENCAFEPIPSVHGEREIGPQLAAAFQAGESGVRSAWASVNDATRGPSAHRLAAMRHAYQDDRLRLAIYWARRGGKQWQAALDRGLRLLGAVYQSMNGSGCSGLLSLGYGIESGTARRDRDRFMKAVTSLRAEVNGGEHEITSQPGNVANTLTFLELVIVRPGESRKALANREAVARLRARLVALASGQPDAPAMPDYREAANDRVAKRHAWNNRHAQRGVPVFLPTDGVKRPNLSAYASQLAARN